MIAFAAHTSYQKRFNKVLSFVAMLLFVSSVKVNLYDFDMVSSVKVNLSTCFRVVVSQQWHGRDVVWGFGKRTVGGARDGDWRRCWVVLTSHCYGSHKGSWKGTAALCRLCALCMDWLFRNLYGSYIAPRPLLSWKKPLDFSFDNMGHFKTCLKKKYNMIIFAKWDWD